MGKWLVENWFTLLSAFGIVGSLLFTAFSLRSETKTRRIANLLTITSNHREIWKQFFDHPELGRVLDPAADVRTQPITHAEEIFVNLVVLHISSVYYTTSDKLVIELEGLCQDIAQFFSSPIPAAIWEKIKPLQNDQLVAFIESCRNWE